MQSPVAFIGECYEKCSKFVEFEGFFIFLGGKWPSGSLNAGMKSVKKEWLHLFL